MATWHTMAHNSIALHSIAGYIIPDQHRHPKTRTIHPFPPPVFSDNTEQSLHDCTGRGVEKRKREREREREGQRLARFLNELFISRMVAKLYNDLPAAPCLAPCACARRRRKVEGDGD